MKKFVFFLLPVVVMGCVKERITRAAAPEEALFQLTSDEVKFLEERNIPAKFDSLEIDRIIGDITSLMERESSTRAGGTRTVRDISPLSTGRPSGRPDTARGGATRSGVTRGGETSQSADETLFHVVNFEDGRGYGIIAADRRIPDEIICFVEHGSFPAAPDRPVDNPGLALMISLAREYALRSLARHDAWCDSVETKLVERYGVGSLDEIPMADTRVAVEPYTPSWHTCRRTGPLIPVEWDQKAPFNATVVENTPWSGTPVGCVALAAVGIMAYWGHPVLYHGLAGGNIDWEEICRWSGSKWDRQEGYRDWEGPMSEAPEETQKLVADILWHVGMDIEMNYGPSASSAYSVRAANLLATHGFSSTMTESYSTERVLNSVTAGRPVLIDGVSHLSEDMTLYANAHAWLIDGYLEQRWWEAFFIDRHMYEIERFRGFFHNNFGWGGLDNGWYACGVFDANNNPDLPSNTRVDWRGDHYNYQFMLTIYPDIYK